MENSTVCQNPWCKATFFYKEEDMIDITENIKNHKLDGDSQNKIPPRTCKKCQSFNNELSGGVSWSQKEYEGSRFDNMPHQIKYKVTNYKL